MSKRCVAIAPFIVSILALHAFGQTPIGSTITYQGQLKQNGSPANNTFNMSFKLWNDVTLAGPTNQIGPTLNQVVSVSNGLFSVQLDFGAAAFNGDRRWLEVTVSGFALTPRTELTATPYARFSTAPWATSGANISNTNGANVGIGTASPAQKLSVAGTIESTNGGFKFPDGSTQNTASTSSFGSSNLVSAWGLNSDGQTTVPPGDFVAIGAGYYHSMAIRSDGTLAGWGYNGDGQTNVPAGTFVAVAGGYSHSIGIRTDGTLAGWGYNGNGQISVPAGTFAAISCGDSHSLGLRSDGTLAAWGQNGSGQTNVPSGTFIAIAAGSYHNIAIRSDGTLVGWGENSDGEINVPSGTYVKVAAGAYHSLAIRTDGTLVGWGYNGYGQTNVPAGTYTAVSAGYSHSLAIRSDGILVAWGDNWAGQSNAPASQCTAISAGDSHTLGIFPAIDVGGGLEAGPSMVHGTLAVDGEASIGGNLAVEGDATFQENAGVLGRLGVGTSFPSCTLEAYGSIRARQGAPGFSGSNNNGFSFAWPSERTSGMYSLSDNQLNFYTGNTERLRMDSSNQFIFFGSSERMRLDANGNIGLGISTPACRLHIVGGADTSLGGGGYLQLGNTFGANISMDENEIMARSNGGVSGLFLNHEGGNVLIADLGAGNLGVGTSNPAQKLHVIGNICATGSIGACSDRRFKTNIKPLGDALALVEKLNPVRFDWKRNEFPDQHFTDQRQIGFIAQDVAEVVPESVTKGSDGYLSVDYGRLTPVVVEALKEQQKQVESLRTENAELRARLERIETALSKNERGAR